MKKRSGWSLGFAGAGVFVLTAALMMSTTGCILATCSGARCHKMASCKSKCAGKCPTPCKNPDGTTKCPPGCKKPCCAEGSKAPKGSARAGGNSPCGGMAAKTAAASSVNKNCPISGKAVRAGVTTVTNGKTIGFCCGGCIGRWSQLTEAEQNKKLAGSM